MKQSFRSFPGSFHHKSLAALTLIRILPVLPVLLLLHAPILQAAWVWVEGEDPESSEVSRHPWWYDKVDKNQLSGGDFLSHFTKEGPGHAEYEVKAPEKGSYHLWLRANPRKAGMSYRVNEGKMQPVDFEQTPLDLVNIAADEKPDLRFLGWVRAGKVKLKKGSNRITFEFNGKDHHHGSLDAFLLTTEKIEPRGALKPDELETADSPDSPKASGKEDAETGKESETE
jgi:hypothetical protein